VEVEQSARREPRGVFLKKTKAKKQSAFRGVGNRTLASA